MLGQYGHIFIFILAGISFCLAPLILLPLIRFRSRDSRQKIAYECGMEPIGTPYVKIDLRFYLFALLFVVFEVESLFLFPWAMVFREAGIVGFIDMMIFGLILFLGLIYTWKRGALQWES